MLEYPKITNSLRQLIKSLRENVGRMDHGLFSVEGIKLCSELLTSDYETDMVIVSNDCSTDILKLCRKFEQNGIEVLCDNAESFIKLSDSKSPQGIMALAKIREQQPDPSKNFIALDAISDPGNMGTIIRTADWFGFDQIILGKGCVDHYNPKVVRSTMGSLFRVKVIQNDSLIYCIKQNFAEHEVFGAVLQDSLPMRKCMPNRLFGLVFGNESSGISKELINNLSIRFTIEGYGKAESLNVSVAAGIAMHYFAQHGKAQK
jgi:TrmH family RNA methyltransferase